MKERLQILSICHNPKNIATYVRAYNLAKSLALRGHEVTLIAVSPDSRCKTKIEREHTLKIVLTPRILHEGRVIGRQCEGHRTDICAVIAWVDRFEGHRVLAGSD